MQWEMESSRLIRCLDPGPLVLVPHTVREIAPHAFSDCTEVVQLVLPNTLERVYDCAFSGCTNLRQVSLHVGVRLRAYGIFQNCPKLAGVVVRRGGYAVQIPIPMDETHDHFLVQLSLLLSEPDLQMQQIEAIFGRLPDSAGKLGIAVYLTLHALPASDGAKFYLMQHRRQLAVYLVAGGVRMCLHRSGKESE